LPRPAYFVGSGTWPPGTRIGEHDPVPAVGTAKA
jgi:hypothetical protein